MSSIELVTAVPLTVEQKIDENRDNLFFDFMTYRLFSDHAGQEEVLGSFSDHVDNGGAITFYLNNGTKSGLYRAERNGKSLRENS